MLQSVRISIEILYEYSGNDRGKRMLLNPCNVCFSMEYVSEMNKNR